MTPLPPLLFVTGMPRSGTTLLSTMLGRHSAIVATPETHFFSRCFREGAFDGGLSREAADRLGQCLQGQSLETQGGTSVAGKLAGTPRGMFERWMRGALAKSEKREVAWLVEKTPAHHEHVERIAAVYPAARFLTIVRDPRAVSASLARVPWNPEPSLHHGRRWRRYAEATRSLDRALGARYRWLRYEDLLADPEVVLRTLCAWLGVAYEPAMLSERAGASTFDVAAEPWKANATRAVDAARSEAWRTELPVAAQKLVELGAGPIMDSFGYEKDQGYGKGQARWTPVVALQVGVGLVAYGPRRLLNKARYWKETVSF